MNDLIKALPKLKLKLAEVGQAEGPSVWDFMDHSIPDENDARFKDASDKCDEAWEEWRFRCSILRAAINEAEKQIAINAAMELINDKAEQS